jgi:hypothetical protein
VADLDFAFMPFDAFDLNGVAGAWNSFRLS